MEDRIDTELHARTRSRSLLPRKVRYAVLAAVAAVLGGALYLLSVRGEALLVDLAGLSQRIFCF
jgi:hypothetical protein